MAPSGVVAVSGGPDSVALLLALLALRKEPSAGPLVIAHLNHQLRGLESDGDEEFVCALHARLAERVGPWLQLRCERLDVAAVAGERKENLEAAAREIRCIWLARVAGEAGVSWVATGHTADDQAETVLHRLLRGTGLRGLRGIAHRRPLVPGIELVRPLLAVRRREVLAYLEQEGQAFREDSSNRDVRFTRNRIRHELLPLLADHYNSGIVDVLGRLAEQAEASYPLEKREAATLLAAVERPRTGNVLVLARQPLADAARHLIRAVLRLLWEREGWAVGAMGFEHWDRLAGVALGEVSAVDLPGGISAQCQRHVIQIKSEGS
jgi:tRNA(Ile)-lysidine synthase